MVKTQKISLVLPAYNESVNIARAVAVFKRQHIFSEILVIDNNSTDATARLARQAGARVVSEPRQGYGFALRRGMAKAGGDLIVLSEPDGTFSAADTTKLLRQAAKFDLVLGTRTQKKFILPGANMSGLLRFGNIALAKLTQLLYRTPPLSDCGCTFRVINKSAVKKLLPLFSVGGSHFLPEMVILAAKKGLTLTEIPVSYGPRIGQSKITGSKYKSVIVGAKMAHLIFSRLYTR